MAEQVRTALTILRLKQLKSRTGRCRSSVYADIAAGTFPPQVKLGPRAVGWLESEVDDWIAGRVKERQKARSTDEAETDAKCGGSKRGRGKK